MGRKPLDLAAVLNRKIKPAFAKLGILGVGWHTFGIRLGAFWPGWANINSPFATTYVTATSTSPTNICRRHRTPNASHNKSLSTRFCQKAHCRRASHTGCSEWSKKALWATGGNWTQMDADFRRGCGQVVENMVGPNGLEPSTSSVSRFSYPIPPTTSIFAEKLLSPSKYAVHGPITG